MASPVSEQGQEKKKGLPKNVRIVIFGSLAALFMIKALNDFFPRMLPGLRTLLLIAALVIFIPALVYVVSSLINKHMTGARS